MKQEEIFESDDEIRAELLQVASKMGRKELKQRFTALDETTGKEIVIKSFKLWWAIAAIGAILVASILFLKPSSPEALFAENYSKFKNNSAPITRGESGDKDLKMAMISYEKGDYGEATMRLDALENNYPEVKIYGGIIAMEENDYQEALDILKPLSIEKDYKFQDAAAWYLALTYLKLEKEEEAEKILQDLSEGSSDYADRSEKLLKKL